MRTSFLVPAILLAIVFGSPPTKADVTFDVAVDVATLAAEVDVLRVNCHTCEGDCGDGAIGSPTAKQVDVGFAPHNFAPGQARTFKGTITVVAHTVRPGNATNYLCYLTIHASQGTPGADEWLNPSMTSRQPWSRPKAGTVLNATIKGDLRRAQAQ